MPVAFNNSDTLNKIDTLSYFVKCAEHYVTSRETSRESFAKWLSVASRPELISTIKGDVNAKLQPIYCEIKRCLCDNQKTERVSISGSQLRCVLYPGVAQGEQIWGAVNVSCERINTCACTIDESCETCIKNTGGVG